MVFAALPDPRVHGQEWVHHIVADPLRWKRRVHAAFKQLLVQLHAAAVSGTRAAWVEDLAADGPAACLDEDTMVADVPLVFAEVCQECGLRFPNRRLLGHHRR